MYFVFQEISGYREMQFGGYGDAYGIDFAEEFLVIKVTGDIQARGYLVQAGLVYIRDSYQRAGIDFLV